MGFKPGRLLSAVGLIVSGALLVLGSMYIAPRSQSWASIWSVLMAGAAAYFAHYLFRGNKDD